VDDAGRQQVNGIFLTGGNGFLGSYAVHTLLAETDVPIFLLVRAPDREKAVARLWESLHLHLDADTFRGARARLVPVCGELTVPGLGLGRADHDRVLAEADSVLHIAASLNRKSEKACLNVNLRGSLSVIKLARELADRGRLRRFTDVSTSAVAGVRQSEVVQEDAAIDWDRSDYDPYGRTKKLAEHMARELLPPESVVAVRPATVLGDSRKGPCLITDMVRAFVALADMRIAPLDPDARLDIVPGDWVGPAIARLHVLPKPKWDIYNLSAGTGSATGRSIAAAMAEAGHTVRFARALAPTFDLAVRMLDRLPQGPIQQGAAVLKVFWPYITYDTVFDNTRATTELASAPARFESYCAATYAYAKSVGMRNPPPPPLP
jgi:nucleoside-diphosphate-sugar epimerase